MQSVITYELDRLEKETIKKLTFDKSWAAKKASEFSAVASNLLIDKEKYFKRLRKYFRENFRTMNKAAVLKIVNLPDESLENPTVFCFLITSILGTVVPEYNGGLWLKNVKLDQSLEGMIGRPSARDSRKFMLHTDLSYTDKPPPFFLFYCINTLTYMGGESIIASIHQIEKNLSQEAFCELQKDQFLFPVPEYCCNIGKFVKSSVLYKDDSNRLAIRYRRDGIKSRSRRALDALAELNDVIMRCVEKVFSTNNSIIIFDNEHCLHGRTGFLEEKKSCRHMVQAYFT